MKQSARSQALDASAMGAQGDVRPWLSKKILAVVGCQRSGTTLTGQILGAHPNALLLDEPDGVYKWFRAATASRANTLSRWNNLLGRAGRKYLHPECKMTHDNGTPVILNGSVTTLVLKAPNLTFDWVRLHRLSNSAIVCYPVRDPRSVVTSMMQLPNDFAGWQTKLIDRRLSTCPVYEAERSIISSAAAPIWVRYAAIWKIKSGLAPSFRDAGFRVFRFRYEDLVQTAEIIRELLNQSTLHHDEAALEPHLVYKGNGPGGTARTRAIDASSLRSWEASLNSVQISDIMKVAGPLAQELGYF